MNLERLKTRIERAQARLYEYTREHGDQCECRLIHIIEGQVLSEEAQAIVEVNKRCAERHAGLSSHVGFNTVILAPLKFHYDENKPMPPAA